MPPAIRATGARGRQTRRPDPAFTADAIGVGVVAVLAGWLLLVPPPAGGNRLSVIVLLLGVLGVFAVARLVSFASAWAVPAAVSVWAAWVAIDNFDVLLSGPLSSPLGYQNATATFYVLATAAALMLALRARVPGVRGLAVVAAAGFAIVPLFNNSDAGTVLVLSLGLAALAAAGPRAVRGLVLAGATAVVVALAVTIWLGVTYDPRDRGGAVDDVVDATLSERRPALWHDALALMRAEPLTGVGIGGFAEQSPTSRSDRDAVWAHNAYLEMGAEAGVVGFLLTLALVLWGLARLWWSPLDPAAAVAVLALAAMGVHASIDYVLHFPEVPLAAAAIVGAGSALPPRGRRTRVR